MEKQIKNLVELAKQYYQYAIEEDFPGSHTFIETEYGELSIYIATERRDVYSVRFDGVEIAGYSKKIGMPWTTTAETLQKIYDDFSKYLKTEKDKMQERVAVQRAERIQNLEEELTRLKDKTYE